MDTGWNLARGITRPAQAQRGRLGIRQVEPKARATRPFSRGAAAPQLFIGV